MKKDEVGIKVNEIPQETRNNVIKGLLICLKYQKFGIFDFFIRKEIAKYLISFIKVKRF